MMNALNLVQVEADVAVPHFETTPPLAPKKEWKYIGANISSAQVCLTFFHFRSTSGPIRVPTGP